MLLRNSKGTIARDERIKIAFLGIGRMRASSPWTRNALRGFKRREKGGRVYVPAIPRELEKDDKEG